jgi:hypothetical protein
MIFFALSCSPGNIPSLDTMCFDFDVIKSSLWHFEKLVQDENN